MTNSIQGGLAPIHAPTHLADFSANTPFTAAYPVASVESIYSNPNSIFGLSKATIASEKILGKLVNSKTPSNFYQTQITSIAEQLFDASAYAKIKVSEISMHLDKDFKSSLFKQIDNVLDQDEWDPDDKLMQRDSFKWFLKAILDLRPEKAPSLGISNKGNIFSAWVRDKNRLILEFLPNGLAKWSITLITDEFEEFSSAVVSVQLLKSKLARYQPEFWFNK